MSSRAVAACDLRHGRHRYGRGLRGVCDRILDQIRERGHELALAAVSDEAPITTPANLESLGRCGGPSAVDHFGYYAVDRDRLWARHRLATLQAGQLQQLGDQ